MSSLCDQIEPVSSNDTIAYHLKCIKELYPEVEPATLYSYFPVVNHAIHKFIVEQEAGHWPHTEFNFTTDISDYENCSEAEKNLLDRVNSFFASSDGIVNDSVDVIAMHLPIKEIIAWCRVQMDIERIHMFTYGLVINTLVQDPKHRHKILTAANHMPVVRNKGEWMEKWMDSNVPVEYKIMAVIIEEGIFFMTSFLSIFYFRKSGRFPSLIAANTQINRDEELHLRAWITILSHLPELFSQIYKPGEAPSSGMLPIDHCKQMIEEGVTLEKEFAAEVVPDALGDFSKEALYKYIEILANDIFLRLYPGSEPMYTHDRKSLPRWMSLGDQIKTNFYESTVTAYTKDDADEIADIEGVMEKRAKDLDDAFANPGGF